MTAELSQPAAPTAAAYDAQAEPTYLRRTDTAAYQAKRRVGSMIVLADAVA